jgi:predicted RNase H-like HicB family nuclease
VSELQNIEIEYDRETRSHFIIWEPLVISLGRTPEEALRDLREAAHLGVDTWIDLKLEEIKKEKEG